MLSGEPLTFFANTEAEQSVSTDKTEKVDSDQDKVAENKEMTSDTPTMTRDSVSFLSFLPMPNMDADIANQPTESGQDSQKQQGEEQAVNPLQDNDGGQIPVPPPLVTAETVKTGDVMTYADLDLPMPSPQVQLPPKEETQYADLQFAQN
ncbi:uncharacterized protein [Ptychodera flava]|uniref:uncharacterized protein n=1 Tax=Ptychodera flava TaxID=63121 RepID=UPI003969E05E